MAQPLLAADTSNAEGEAEEWEEGGDHPEQVFSSNLQSLKFSFFSLRGLSFLELHDVNLQSMKIIKILLVSQNLPALMRSHQRTYGKLQ